MGSYLSVLILLLYCTTVLCAINFEPGRPLKASDGSGPATLPKDVQRSHSEELKLLKSNRWEDDDCNDNNDYDYCIEGLSTLVIVLIVFGSLVPFIIGAVLICYCCACCCFIGRKTQTGGQVHSAPGAVLVTNAQAHPQVWYSVQTPAMTTPGVSVVNHQHQFYRNQPQSPPPYAYPTQPAQPQQQQQQMESSFVTSPTNPFWNSNPAPTGTNN